MRLLVVTDFPPDAAGGGPAVVRQMLHGYSGEVHWWSVRSDREGSTDTEFKISSRMSCSPGKMLPARRLTRFKSFLMERLWTPLAVRSLQATISRVGPDCIWAIPHDWSIPALHGALVGSGRCRANHPYHVSIHDYVDVHRFPEQVGEQRCRSIRSMQNELFRYSQSRDVICAPMAEDLRDLTGVQPNLICRKGIESDDLKSLENIPPRSKETEVIKIAYAGSVLLHEDFARLMTLLDKVRGIVPLELHLFGAHDYSTRDWFRPWMMQHGNLSEEELRVALDSMDWGLSIMSIEDVDPAYNRYSFPAKFCTYFPSGLPVITAGHSESSVMKMASAYEVGISMSDYDTSPSTLSARLADPDAKARYRSEIVRCAREQFDAEKMRRQLWQCFSSPEST